LNEIKVLHTSYSDIEYIKFGSGEKNLVIIPGLSIKSVLLSSASVKKAYNELTEDYTIYLFDRPLSVNNNSTIDFIAECTAQAMTQLGLFGSCLFGASQGGMIAQCIAIHHPELVYKLALGSTMSRENDLSKANLILWRDFAANRNPVGLYDSFISLIYTKELAQKYRGLASKLGQDVTDDELDRFICMIEATKGFDVSADLKKIQCPVLVIAAGQDRVLSTQASYETADILNCSLYVYEDFGHAVYDEAGDYKKRLSEFFNG